MENEELNSTTEVLENKQNIENDLVRKKREDHEFMTWKYCLGPNDGLGI